MYVHGWHYGGGIYKYPCVSGITEGKAKGKANPVQASTGTEVSRILRF